jgi:CHAT domain-containing protein
VSGGRAIAAGWRLAAPLALGLAVPAIPAGPDLVEHPALAPGTSQFELGLEAAARHPLALAAGDLLEVELREKGPRIVLTLVDDTGAVLARREAPAETMTTLRLVAVAPARGIFALEVRSSSDGRAGGYEVRLEEPRAADEADRARADGDEALAEAVKLLMDGTAESRKRALARLDVADDALAKAADRRGQAIAVLKRGGAQFDSGAPAAAETLERSLRLFRERDDAEGEGAALLALATTKVRAGDYDGARAGYDAGAAIARRIGNQSMLAAAVNNLAVTFGRTGQLEKAAEVLAQAVSVAREAGLQRMEARALNGLGVTSKDLGDRTQALVYYERSLSLARAVGWRQGEAITGSNIANIHMDLGDYDRAITLLEDALPIAHSLGLVDVEARILNNMAKALGRRGDLDRAIELGRRSLQLRRDLHERVAEAASLGTLGRNLHRAGQSEAGLEHLGEALRIQQAIGDRYAQAESLSAMATIERDRDDLRAARGHAEAAVALIEELRSGMTNPDLRASFVADEQDVYGISIDILMRLHAREPEAGHDAAALQMSERARARVLLDALIQARADVREGVEPALLERERALQKELSEASTRLTRALGRDGASPEVKAAREQLEAKAEEYRQVQTRIRLESPRYAALTQPSPATVDEIRRGLLDDDTVLLEFYVGKDHHFLTTDRSFLWAVTRSALLTHSLPEQATLEAAARKVHALMIERQRTRAPDAVREADRLLQAESKALSRMLLGGVADRLETDWKGKRLLIVSSGALAYLPFGALPSPAGDSTRPLLLDHEVVFAPSASVLLAQRQEARPSAPSVSVAVLADPVFEKADPRVGARGPAASAAAVPVGLTRAMESLGRAGFTRLPFSRREADAIAALVPSSSLLKATDFAASRTLVARGALDHHRIVHFATHGLLDSEHPDLSGLVLSLVDEKGAPVDGFLRMHEIYNLHLPADLVVLSACQTALGREIRGEGLVGLTRGFMYAGARAVVASLWQVDDESTAELMKRFYRAMLKDGRRPADALRAAQLELSRHPRWAAPFYWAGFVLQGEFR